MPRYLKRHIVHLLLFFYVTSSYLGATHIHHDALASHDDCKVCIVVKNLHNGKTSDSVTLPLADTIRYQKIALYHSLFVVETFKGFDAHAPPLFS